MRTGLGAAPADIARITNLTRAQTIELIVQEITTKPDIPMPDWVEQPLPPYHARPDMDDRSRARFNKARDAELAQLRQWWVLNMLETTSPQTERMVLFWHDLFATNYHDLGKQSLAMARQNQTFRELGFGSWEQLLKAIIRDAALLQYLNSGSNHKASPNENLARELMELFVLGEGNYDEADVREAARALTGHDTSRTHDLQFRLKTWAQDRNEKLLFAQRGKFDGDDLIELLLEQEAAPRFLAARFWHAFISDSPPDAGWLDKQAMQFRQSGLNIVELYTNVLQSEAFWQARHRGAIIKSPVDMIIGTARTLDYPKRHWQQMPQWLRSIGMDLFAPPNVSGWKEGAGFITPGRLLNRYKVIQQLTKEGAQQSSQSSAQMMMSEPQMQSGLAADDYRGPLVDTKPLKEQMVASAIHVGWGAHNEESGKRSLEIFLDHLQTPSLDYQHVRFLLEKRMDRPILLQFDTFSCWPDCIEHWPECAWQDKHFKASRSVSFPWASKASTWWSSQHTYHCQYKGLSNDEQQLASSLLANLPQLLEQVAKTVRVNQTPDRWLPIIEFFLDEYQKGPASLEETPFTEAILPIDIAGVHEPPEHIAQPLPAPQVHINNIEQLSKALEQQQLRVHQLLLPEVAGANTPTLSAHLQHSEQQSSGRYLKAVLESPLLQLK